MTKRPAVMDIEKLMVKPGGRAPEPVAPPPPEKPEKVETFRTSLYFNRAVHDALRTIAFHERCTVSDLVNEGIDAVLKSRNYPPASELKGAKEP